MLLKSFTFIYITFAWILNWNYCSLHVCLVSLNLPFFLENCCCNQHIFQRLQLMKRNATQFCRTFWCMYVSEWMCMFLSSLTLCTGWFIKSSLILIFFFIILKKISLDFLLRILFIFHFSRVFLKPFKLELLIKTPFQPKYVQSVSFI